MVDGVSRRKSCALYRPAITVKAHEPHFVHMIYRTPRLISLSVIIVISMCFRIGFNIGLFSEPERENIMKNCSGCAIWSRVRPRFVFDHRVQESLCCTQNVERTELRGHISSRGVICVSIFSIAKCVSAEYNLLWRGVCHLVAMCSSWSFSLHHILQS